MKKLILLIFVASVSSLSGQKMNSNDIPVPVKSSFQKQYPTVTKTEWEKEGENFEVEFDLNKTEQSVVYDAKGNLLETEMEIKTEQLPGGVTEYVAATYKGEKIKEASKITDVKGTVTYEAEVKNMDLIFDSTGAFIKIEKDEHDGKGDKD